jgi:hypothetical protein
LVLPAAAFYGVLQALVLAAVHILPIQCASVRGSRERRSSLPSPGTKGKPGQDHRGADRQRRRLRSWRRRRYRLFPSWKRFQRDRGRADADDGLGRGDRFRRGDLSHIRRLLAHADAAAERIAGPTSALPKFVVSSTLETAPWGEHPEVEIIHADGVQALRALRARIAGDLIVWRSLSLCDARCAAPEGWCRCRSVAADPRRKAESFAGGTRCWSTLSHAELRRPAHCVGQERGHAAFIAGLHFRL